VNFRGRCCSRSLLRAIWLAPLAFALAVSQGVAPIQAAEWPMERPASTEIVTYGTLGPAEETEALRLFAFTVATWTGGEIRRVVADHDLTPGDAANVYLVGHPHDHAYFRELETQMPFLISSDGTLTIAGHAFPGPWTLAARFPNPVRDGSFVELFTASDSRFSSDTLSSYHGDTDYTLKYSAVAPAISADFGDPLPEATSSDLTWETYATEHYVFKQPTGGGVDLRGASVVFERAYTTVSSYLGGEYPGAITAYIFPDVATVRKVTGFRGPDDSAFAAPLFGSEFHWSQPTYGGHETAHLISISLWGPAGTDFMREGVAVAAEGRWGRSSPHAWARLYRDRLRLRPISTMLSGLAFYDVDGLVRYPEAGSFVDYVTETYGLDAVRQLWSGDAVDFERAVRDATGKTLVELEAAWRADLSHHLPPFDDPWKLGAAALAVVAAVVLVTASIRRARRRRKAGGSAQRG